MADILVLNGPNLNMLGLREPEIYGSQTLADLDRLCLETGESLGLRVECRQTNDEGQLVTWIQEIHPTLDSGVRGLVLNAAAYTHTSIAIHDALKLLDGVPVIEVHLSDPHAREPFRHHSYVAPLARAVIKGQGAQGYVIALKQLSGILGAPQP